ncbi:MAG: spore maturation protein [Alicyclobacillus sp.]|nr:spore maturation protein [Alicyclobacillus sp.]
MQTVISALSSWVLPVLVAAILVAGYARRVPVYGTFVDGAKQGFGTAVRLIPHLVAMMVAVQVFRASGAMDLLIRGLAPALQFLHIPPEVAPLGLLRPISSAGSLALMTDVFRRYGVDSPLGLLASTMQASTDTTLYIITVYFGSVGIQHIRYALKVGLLADFVSVLASVFAVHLLTGL